jgi:peptidoglycan/LPS O-acetylase OafA/YrhL
VKTRLFQNALFDLAHKPRHNYPPLDILRSSAILLVVCAHAGALFSPFVKKLPFVFYGWTGVDLFFVLSGFLIGGQLWKELQKSGTIDIGRFVLRRGFRIWPYYYFAIAAIAVLAMVQNKPLSGFSTDLLCVSNYFPGKSQVSGGWSLSTEEQFYILTPVILFMASRWIPSRKLLSLPVAWLFALPLVRWITVRHAPASAIERLTYFPFHTHSDGLAAGLVIAWIMVFRPDILKGERSRHIAVLLGAFAVAFMMRHWNQAVFRFSSLALIFGSTTFFLLAVPVLPRLMNWHGGYIMSRLSYGMYLNHFYVIGLAEPLQRFVGHGLAGFLLTLPVCVLVSLAVAFLTFALVELPFLKLREQWLARQSIHPGTSPLPVPLKVEPAVATPTTPV